MKKQIAILASIIAAGGFSAFGQDWITVAQSGNGIVWDEYTTPGSSHDAPAGDVTVQVLWALNGTSDPLGAGVGTSGTAASGAVQTITSMLSGGGWTLMQNDASGLGSAALGTVQTTTGGTATKGGSIVAFNAGNPFEFDTATAAASGANIEYIFLAFNSAASSYTSAADLGYSSLGTVSVGTTSGDPNATSQESSPAFGVAQVTAVPEPATLALAGLGGLSMLFLRRRKA
jgi:PEP-CTERM motif